MTASTKRMSDIVTLHHDGLYVGDHAIEPQDVIGYWRNEIELTPGVQLGALLSVLDTLPYQDLEAVEHITNSSIEPFLDELDDEIPFVPPETDVSAIYVQRRVACRQTDARAWLDDYISVSGIESREPCDLAVDFVPLNVLASAPMYLARKGVFWSTSGEVISIEQHITLGELVEAVLDEVTWYGSPADRNEALQHLIESRQTEE